MAYRAEQMPNEGKHTVMSQSAYARHRGKSRQYISQLAQAGVLVMRGGKVDVEASDTVLDDRPVADVDPPTRPMRIAEDLSQGQPDSPGRVTFSQARTIEMVYRAKLCRLDFEAKVGKLIDGAEVRNKISAEGRAFRDGLLGIPDRLSMIIASERDAGRIRSILRAEIDRELDRLAEALQNVGMGTVPLVAR